MDFTSEDWDVGGEASHLVDNLFGELSSVKSKKAKKRKQKDATSPANTGSIKKPHSDVEHIESAKPATVSGDKQSPKTNAAKKKKKKRKKDHINSESGTQDTSKNGQSQTAGGSQKNVKSDMNAKKKTHSDGSKGSSTNFPTLKDFDKTSKVSLTQKVTEKNMGRQEKSLKVLNKKTKRKMTETDETSLNKGKGIVNNKKEHSEMKKRKVGNESTANLAVSNSGAAGVVSESTKDMSKHTKESTENKKSDEGRELTGKKKRKRNYKKNKFKDYSKETADSTNLVSNQTTKLADSEGQKKLANSGQKKLSNTDGQKKLANSDGQKKLSNTDSQKKLANSDGQKKLANSKGKKKFGDQGKIANTADQGKLANTGGSGKKANKSSGNKASFSTDENAISKLRLERKRIKRSENKKKKKERKREGKTNQVPIDGQKTETASVQGNKKAPPKETLSENSPSQIKLPFDPKELSAMLSPTMLSMNSNESQDGQNEFADRVLAKKAKSGKSLLEKNQERLNAARFRYLNEQLYTSTGQEALKLFKKDREAFNVYHEGFQGQVEKWPANPVDVIIDYIKTKQKSFIVADFGCGDAKIARSVANKVHSFDLVALNDHVTVCDMSKVPLDNSSVDIAVFCLSLMGTNLTSFLQEANRVLKNGGTLLIAEVTSRFQSVGQFVLQVEKLGFKIRNQDAANKMFVLMDFKKTSLVKPADGNAISLKPCVYKKR